MKSPFMFVPISGKRRLLYAATAAALSLTLAAGLVTVHVRSYNILHAEPMEVLGLYNSSEGTGVVLLGHFYLLWPS